MCGRILHGSHDNLNRSDFRAMNGNESICHMRPIGPMGPAEIGGAMPVIERSLLENRQSVDFLRIRRDMHAF